jgi:peptidoglycan hydrolase CwlO-like protein
LRENQQQNQNQNQMIEKQKALTKASEDARGGVQQRLEECQSALSEVQGKLQGAHEEILRLDGLNRGLATQVAKLKDKIKIKEDVMRKQVCGAVCCCVLCGVVWCGGKNKNALLLL